MSGNVGKGNEINRHGGDVRRKDMSGIEVKKGGEKSGGRK
jgi:hypothetical protein